MEKQSSNKGLWVIGAILLIIILILCFKACRQDKIIDSYQEPKKIDTTMTKWRDKDNKEHAEVKVNTINYANLLESKDAEIAKLKEEIIKNKSIKGKTIIETTTKQTIKVPVKDTIKYVSTKIDKVDTIIEKKSKTLAFQDDWLTLEGKLENDTLSMNYGIKNKLSIYQKTKPNGIFKKDDLYLEIVNDNPSTTTNKVVRYDIEQPPVGFFKSKLFYGILGAVAGGFIVKQVVK